VGQGGGELEELRYRVRGLIWMVSVVAKAAHESALLWTAELERRGRAALTARALTSKQRTRTATEKTPSASSRRVPPT
jgi:hypothetical protein